MDINHNQVVYIPKGKHDNPLELPQQCELEGSTEIEHTVYSHTDTISSETNSYQKLDYIYQHFQDNEKIYEPDPDLATYENDNTLYPLYFILYTLTTILNMVYLKMLLVVII